MKTLKLLSMLIAVTMLGFSCSESDNSGEEDAPTSKSLVLNISSSVIQANGEDAVQLTVLYNGEAITEGVDIYDGATSKIVDLPGLRFSTTKVGKHSFWAAYKTEQSNVVVIDAIEQVVPERPVDPNPERFDFMRHIMFIQFTGTECGYCPYMIQALRSILEKPEYDSHVIHTAIHSYSGSDPACPSNAGALNTAFNVSSFPQAVIDMRTVFKNINAAMQKPLEKVLDAEIARSEAKAGIAVNSVLSGNTLVVRASVKAAETGIFRIGAWLLEDGIYAKQKNYDRLPGDYDTHNNCVRLTDSAFSRYNFTGHFLGSINKGEVTDYVFVMTLDEKWVKENLHVTVFVSTDDDKNFYVNNVVDVPVGELLPFEYK